MTQLKSIKLTLIFISMLFATVIKALPDDAQKELQIDAASSDFDVKTRTMTHTGDVVLEQGSLKINADKIIYYGDQDPKAKARTSKIVAIGNPARFQQTPKLNESPVKAVANRLEYIIKAETLYLIDKASLDQDGSSLSGNRIEYDVKNALVKATGNTTTSSENGRVRMVIPPKKIQSDKDK